MEVRFEIPEDKIKNFSSSAKNKIIEHAKKHTLDIVNESERIEISTHEGDSTSEITSSHVVQATNKFRSMCGIRKRKKGITILKIISEVLIWVSGIMFLPEQFVTENGSFNIVYFIIFIIVMAIALITTITSHFLGGE